MQNVVGILSQADKFNTTLTATSESREIEGGKVVEVRTLYWGLATAYYVDASGEYAGIGYTGPDGWEWPQIEGKGAAINANYSMSTRAQERSNSSKCPLASTNALQSCIMQPSAKSLLAALSLIALPSDSPSESPQSLRRRPSRRPAIRQVPI